MACQETALLKHAIRPKPYNLPSVRHLLRIPSHPQWHSAQVCQAEFSGSMPVPVLPEPSSTGPRTTAHVPIDPGLAMRRSGATGWLNRRGLCHTATLCSAGLGIASEFQRQTSPLHVAEGSIEVMASPRNLAMRCDSPRKYFGDRFHQEFGLQSPNKRRLRKLESSRIAIYFVFIRRLL